MASSACAKHGLLNSKTSLYQALIRKISPGGVCIQRAAEIQSVRAAAGATAAAQPDERYCLELVRWGGPSRC